MPQRPPHVLDPKFNSIKTVLISTSKIVFNNLISTCLFLLIVIILSGGSFTFYESNSKPLRQRKLQALPWVRALQVPLPP